MTQLFMLHPGPLTPTGSPVPDGVTLRPATREDADALSRLLTAAFQDGWSPRRVLAELLDVPDVVRTWITTVDGDVVGTASERLAAAYPRHGYVHWVGVHPKMRGRRLGEVLTRACLAGFASRQVDSAVLETDDFRLAAVRTYLRVGFVPEYRSAHERTAWSGVFQQLAASQPKGSLVQHV
jgi:mycothiol synthase